MLELLYTLVAPRLMLFLILMIPVYSLRGLLKMFHVHWGQLEFCQSVSFPAHQDQDQETLYVLCCVPVWPAGKERDVARLSVATFDI